jgi:hypothetical protein
MSRVAERSRRQPKTAQKNHPKTKNYPEKGRILENNMQEAGEGVCGLKSTYSFSAIRISINLRLNGSIKIFFDNCIH